MGGKFIVLEGIDGSGTTTQAALLEEWCRRQGWPVHRTEEPSQGPVGALIRLALAGRLGARQAGGAYEPLDEATLALCFAADRMDHLRCEVQPRLAAGITVICDRYYLSSLAYQSVELDYQWVKALNSRCPPPDLTLFLDVPPAVCQARMRAARRQPELYEDVERQEKVRAQYLRAIADLRQDALWVELVEGDRPAAEVHQDIVRLVARLDG